MLTDEDFRKWLATIPDPIEPENPDAGPAEL